MSAEPMSPERLAAAREVVASGMPMANERAHTPLARFASSTRSRRPQPTRRRNMADPIKVTVTDPASGDVLAEKVIDDDYVILCAGNRYVDGIQQYPKAGTTVITVKTDRGAPTDQENDR